MAFGLKLVYGDAVHCFFAEPTHAPCMMLGLVTGLQDQVCVQDFGIDNRTAADGLAVGRPSSFVGKTIQPFLSGSYTISDEKMYHYLAMLADAEDIWLEPSALAGMAGPLWLLGSRQGQEYLKDNGLAGKENQITWMPWATGGNMGAAGDHARILPGWQGSHRLSRVSARADSRNGWLPGGRPLSLDGQAAGSAAT